MEDRIERRKQFRGGFRTKREAQLSLNEALASLGNGTYVPPARQRLADYLLEEWLPARRPTDGVGRRHRGQLSVGTWHDYRILIRSYVVPYIGSIPLEQLGPADLNRLYDELEAHGRRGGRPLSPKSVLNIHRLVHKALGDAVKQGRIARNPAALVQAPSAPKAVTAVWSAEQLRAFLRHVADDRFYTAWLLFATTGMRRGEVAGLAWSDIDLDAGHLRVRVTLGVVDGKATWKPRPKTAAGERTMALDPATVEALQRHRSVQQELKARAGEAWIGRQHDWRGAHRDDLVFTWPDGGLIHPERFSRWFLEHHQAAGLPRIRLHDVRHTYATAGLASATGWHEVKVLASRLGHSTIGIFLDTYAHVLPVADEETANTLARAILGE